MPAECHHVHKHGQVAVVDVRTARAEDATELVQELLAAALDAQDQDGLDDVVAGCARAVDLHVHMRMQDEWQHVGTARNMDWDNGGAAARMSSCVYYSAYAAVALADKKATFGCCLAVSFDFCTNYLGVAQDGKHITAVCVQDPFLAGYWRGGAGRTQTNNHQRHRTQRHDPRETRASQCK